MPLILSYNEHTESGHDYQDKVDTGYHFPSRYNKLVTPGEVALLYAGRRSARLDGKPGYFGLTHILEVFDTGERSGIYKMMDCTTGFTTLFETPVNIKTHNGSYYEQKANSHKTTPIFLIWSTGDQRIRTGRHIKEGFTIATNIQRT